MDLLIEYFVPWVISNSIALLLTFAAIKSPRLSRLLFSILFIWASWINCTTAHDNPNDYLNYAALTPFHVYQEFIQGWFKMHITPVVTLIAVGQGFIGIGLLLKGWVVQFACIAAIVFFLAIAPLGIGSGFPSSIIASIGVYFIFKSSRLHYLWKSSA